jgi:hypothetical protein
LTLLTFRKKYVKASTTAVSTTSASLVDDSEAVLTFTLNEPGVVLVIYQANNLHDQSMPTSGFQIAVSIDGVDKANSWDSPVSFNHCARNCVFWVGTLSVGTHTIKGRFASNTGGATATINNRILLVIVFKGDEFYYIDNSSTATTSSTSMVDDPYAQVTFTPSGTCKALVLYNCSNTIGLESTYGKKVAINIAGIDYAQAEKSPYDVNYPDSVFTCHALSLSPVPTTVKGRFANAGAAETVTIHRRQLAVLLFADSTLLNISTSTTEVSTTSNTLVDDPQAILTRTTDKTRELLVIAMGTKRNGVTSHHTGECYGININGVDRANSRGSPYNSSRANSVATAYAILLTAGSHTIKGRFSNNYNAVTAKISARQLIALWFEIYGETRYFRSDTHTINGLTAYQLKTVNSVTLTSVSGDYPYWGIRVFVRHANGTEEEVTDGTPVCQIFVSSPGWYNASWDCPSRALQPTDTIVVRLYNASSSSGPWTLKRTWITEQLNAQRLDDSTWVVFYYFDVQVAIVDYIVTSFIFRHGSATYNSRIEGFAYTLVLAYQTISRAFGFQFKLFSLLRQFLTSSSFIRTLISRSTTFFYSVLNKILRSIVSIFKLRYLLSKTSSGLYSIRVLTTKTWKSLYSIFEKTFRTIVGIYRLKSLLSRSLSLKFGLRNIVTKMFRSLSNIRIKVLQFFSSIYRIISIYTVTTILTVKHNVAGLVKKFISGIHNLSALVEKLSSSIYSLRITISKLFKGFYSLKMLIVRTFSSLYKLKALVGRLIISLSRTLQIVPRIVGFKYNTRISITRVLSSKFGIGAIITRILSFFYRFVGFYIVSVTADPFKVIRTGPETVRLRCDWHDEADLDPELYECKFWVRDEMGNIYGPFIGTVVKKDSKQYYATYDLDPTETFLLGYYDIRVEVTKYG